MTSPLIPSLPAVPPAPLPPPETPNVVLGLVRHYNHTIWPLPIVGVMLMFGVLLAVYLRPGAIADILAKIALDLAWLWVGVSFFWLNVASEFREGYLWGALFLAQGTAFLIDAFFGTLEFRPARSRYLFWLTLILAVVAAAEPAVGHLVGRRWPTWEVVGTTPGPTAAFTAVLLLTTVHRPRPWFFFLPAAWAVAAGVRFAAVWGWHETLVPAAVAGVAVIAFALSFLGKRNAAQKAEE